MSDDDLARLMLATLENTKGQWLNVCRRVLDVAESEIRRRVLYEVLDRIGKRGDPKAREHVEKLIQEARMSAPGYISDTRHGGPHDAGRKA